MGPEHGYSEHAAESNTKTTGEAVDTIDHVHGVDDAYACKYGEGYANPPGEAFDAPEAVQTVNASSIAVDDAEDSEDFDDDAIARAEVDDVVDGADVEHHAHSCNNGEDDATVVQTFGKQRPAKNAEEYGDASHNGYGALLQLACVGIIDEVLRFSNGKYLEIDPERHHHRDERCGGEKD